MRPSQAQLWLYGYRMEELKQIDIKPVKDSLKFKRIVPQQGFSRRLVSTSLPLTFVGATPPRADPSHASSYAGGVLKRIGPDTGQINRKMKRLFRKFVRKWLRKNLVPLTDSDVPTFDQWLEETPYSRGRKNELKEVWMKYLKKPKKSDLKKVKSFVKDEPNTDYKYPRTINSRVDVAKCQFGPICSAASKAVFANPNFIKTIPVSERAKAIKEKIYVHGEECDSTDYTSYEAHFTAERMRLTTGELFKWLFSTCSAAIKSIAKLMMEVLTSPSNFSAKFVSFVMGAVRCSGEMDTSLSNGFANAMTIEFLADLYNNKAHFYVEGDDGIIRWVVKDRRPPDQAYKDLGLTIKIVSSTELSELSFCGQVYDMDDLVVITDVKEQLARFGWTNSRYVQASYNTRMQLLKAKGYAMVYQYNGCPILSKLGRRILQLTSQTTIRKRIVEQWDPHKRELLVQAMTSLPEEIEPKPATRLLVERLYGIPVWQQYQIEDQLTHIELGSHNLPFDTPASWRHYFDTYSTTVPDGNPTWIKPTNRGIYERYIRTFSNLNKFKFNLT